MAATDVAPPGNGTDSDHHIQFELHAPDFHAPPDIVHWAHEKLETRLKKYERRVLGVSVHLRDINGPKGGIGISCHIEAHLRHMEPVNVEEQGTDLRAAIDLAIDRIGVVIGRHIEKARKAPVGRKLARDGKATPG